MTGRGPYPFLIAFFATRDHLDLSGLRPTRPPWLILLPRMIICFTFTPSQVSYSWKKSYLKRSDSLCPLRAQWWSPFFLLTELLLRTVHIKHYYGFIWNLPCPAATPTFFTSLVFQQQDHMRFPIQILSQFWKFWFYFFCRFSENKLITSFELKKKRKTLKDSKTLLWLSSISVLFVGGQWCSLSGTTRVPGSISKCFG